MSNDTFESQVMQSALRYARMGFSVFTVHSILDNGACTCGNESCNSPGKHPRTAHGVKDATKDETAIRALFMKHPYSNIGIATGAVSGICVVDIDPRNGGDESFAEYEKVHGCPRTPECLTGGKGRHFYFKLESGQSLKSCQLMDGVDFQSDGKYVVAPPSRHKSGFTYGWNNDAHIDDLPLIQLPTPLLERIRRDKSTFEKTMLSRTENFVGADRAKYLMSIAGTLRRRGASAAIIEAALLAANKERCEPPVSDKSLNEIAASIAKYDPAAPYHPGTDSAQFGGATWPDLREMPPKCGKAPNLEPNLIPEPMRAWVLDCAERLSVPLEFIFFPALSGLAVALGCRLGITPKKNDFGWIVTAAGLWCALIASPGKKKSPALNAALYPLNKIDKSYRDQYREEYEKSRSECDVLEQKILGLKRKISTYAGKKSTKDLEKELYELKASLEDITPAHKRITIQDATVQKIADLLVQKSNQHGLGVTLDELTTWMKALERPGQEGSRGFFLKAWNGYQSEAIDRIGRGSTFIESLYIVVVGGIQPDVFESFMSEARKVGFAADGMMQRFQLAVLPDLSNPLPIIDRAPDSNALARVCEIFERVHQVIPEEVGAVHLLKRTIPTIQFCESAQLMMDDFLMKLEGEILSLEDSVLESHVSKYRSTMPALALIIELVHSADKKLVGNKECWSERSITVSADSTRMAVALVEYLASHAKVIYGFTQAQEIAAAHCLRERILRGDVESGTNVRSIYRRGWRNLSTVGLVRSAAELLEDHGYLRIEERSKAGSRPSQVLVLRPALIPQEGA